MQSLSHFPSIILERTIFSRRPPDHHRSQDKEMQVLCLGLSRSGTDSLRSALMILGYPDVYHGFVLQKTQYESGDCAFWVPLMRRKFAGKPLENVDFDSVLANFEAVTDCPANIFGRELMEFYPHAKVILNRRRNIDAWYDSMQSTIMAAFSWSLWTLTWFDSNLCWLWWAFDLAQRVYYENDFNKNGKRVAQEHYCRLEDSLAEQQREYLDWTVQDGWEPLCKFLGKPVPDVPFPDNNKSGGDFEKKLDDSLDRMVKNAFRNIYGLSAVALGVGAWLYCSGQ
ncbi:hypothetical protein N7478_004634 [Penicillium angulare]|uniref:uncharacterized protein n=1 Tax=Penicillium angulare TaxID=116970 RepID=UPI0025420A4C|nr:uncharacterized protein N7478_004634 [Penicillium angulare]KAJ5279262.1 hypothetical protein N7478_004634 [Penicillium angulare]